MIRSFFSGPAGLVEQRDGSTTVYPLPDAHGDVTTFTNDSGATVSRQEFDPWGEQLAGPALESQPNPRMAAAKQQWHAQSKSNKMMGQLWS